MILPNQLVTHSDTRPNSGLGKAGKCFYCTAKQGTEHDAACVCRLGSVVVRTTFEYVVDVPEFWDGDQIEFHRNESSSCAANIIQFLASRFLSDDDGGKQSRPCPCHCTNTEYVREATAEDDARWGYGMAELKAEHDK